MITFEKVTKEYPDGRRFAVLDAGMTELMRPALYGSFHRIVPVSPRTRRLKSTATTAANTRSCSANRAPIQGPGKVPRSNVNTARCRSPSQNGALGSVP